MKLLVKEGNESFLVPVNENGDVELQTSSCTQKEPTGLLNLDFLMSDTEDKKEVVTETKKHDEVKTDFDFETLIEKEITTDNSRAISKVIEINIDDKDTNLCSRSCIHQSRFDDPNNLCYLFFSCDRKLNQDKKTNAYKSMY